jgi:hypothetical protein
MRIYAYLLIVLSWASVADASNALSAADAINHVGTNATVCGTVASAKYASSTRGSPTFLNLDRPYPNHVFSALIWGSDRSKFGQPEITHLHKRVCVSGTIEAYKGEAEIILRNESQITSD